MKTLVLSDETADRMLSVLRASKQGRAVLESFNQEAEPIGEAELNRAVRLKQAPASWDKLADRHAALKDAYEQSRAELHGLIQWGHDMGVGTTNLGRWSKLAPSTVTNLIRRRDGR